MITDLRWRKEENANIILFRNEPGDFTNFIGDGSPGGYWALDITSSA
jgi:hypothetical protein